MEHQPELGSESNRQSAPSRRGWSWISVFFAFAIGCGGEASSVVPSAARASSDEPRPSAKAQETREHLSAEATASAGSERNLGAPSGTALGSATLEAPKFAQPLAIQRQFSEEELPFQGRTIDFHNDGKSLGGRSRAYDGRVFVHRRAFESAGAPLPLVIFFHGLNRAKIPHRWMGGGTEGDVRLIARDLLESGATGPFVLAGPGSQSTEAVGGQSSFPVFDLPRFIEETERALDGAIRIDRTKVIVMGHSGAGCSEKGGIVTALTLKPEPRAVVSIDTCMTTGLAKRLAASPSATDVVVTWQSSSWNREFAAFKKVFLRETPAGVTGLRTLDHLPSLAKAHDATVKQTFDKYLPLLVPPQ